MELAGFVQPDAVATEGPGPLASDIEAGSPRGRRLRGASAAARRERPTDLRRNGGDEAAVLRLEGLSRLRSRGEESGPSGCSRRVVPRKPPIGEDFRGFVRCSSSISSKIWYELKKGPVDSCRSDSSEYVLERGQTNGREESRDTE